MRFRRMWIATLLTVGCGDPSGPETVHDGAITDDETWGPNDSPHVVRGRLSIALGVTLRIEAGATVLFDSAATLIFEDSGGTGRLLALGSPAAPVTMRSLHDGAARAWIGLRFRDNTASVLRHVNLSGCGAVGLFDTIPAACIALGNPLVPDERPTLLLDHVTVGEGRGGAVTLWSRSEFEVGSSVLSVQNMNGYVARMRAREAARFPLGGTYTGNDTNEVRLGADTLADSLTLTNGVPWAVEDTILVEGLKEPVLTIPAGGTIRLTGALRAGERAPGGIQIGTDGGPTVSLLPRATSWDGVDFRSYAVRSSISDAVLESCGTAGMPCVSIVGSFTGGPAPAPVLRNLTIRNAIGGGLTMTYGGRPGPGSANLTITGGAAEPLTVEHSPVSAIPPGQYTGNARDRISINRYDVRQNDTWPDHGVPYYIKEYVSVGDAVTDPTLTVEPGVTVTSAVAVDIRVGETQPGALHAVGTAAEPITFRGETSAPGSWTGIVIGPLANPSTALNHVIVDYGGGPFDFEGSVSFYVDLGPIIRNTTIRNSATCGVTIVNQPPWSTDFTSPALGNTFTNNARGAVCGP